MKKGILAVSFGTSHIDTMEKTIDVLEKEFAKTFEEAVVYRAFTSNMIIKKLKRTANCLLYTSPSPRDRQKSRMPSSA